MSDKVWCFEVLYLEGFRERGVYFYFFLNLIYLFLAVLGLHFCAGLSLVAASGGRSSSRCTGLSLSRLLLLWSTGSRHAGSVVVANGPSCSVACGIFPDQGSNPCPLHWQADSQPLHHQGSLREGFRISIEEQENPAHLHSQWNQSRVAGVEYPLLEVTVR